MTRQDLVERYGGRASARTCLVRPDWVEHRFGNRVAISIGLSVRERHCRSRPVELLDLSSGGCRVLDSVLRIGQRLWITLDGLAAIEGTALWQHRGETGIAFNSPLHPAVLDHLIARHPRKTATESRGI